jgi:small-conductance mechanosensitive channel
MELPGIGLNYILAAMTIVLGIMLAYLTRRAMHWLEVKALETETQWDDIIIAAIGTPVQFAIIVILTYYAFIWFDVFPQSMQWIHDPSYTNAFYIFISAWILATFLHSIIHIYGRTLAEKSETDLDDRIVDLLELVIRYVIWFVAVMAILHVFNIDITPLMAGAGIAGLAVALAAQDLISNFFGGAIITVDKPFKVGDRIRIDTYYGDVLSVGTRSTRIKTLDNEIVTIPNSKLTTNSVINFSEPDPKLRMTIPLSVAYGTDPLKVKKILLEVAKDAINNNDYLVDDPAPSAFFIEFADSSLNFIIRVWTRHVVSAEMVKDAINCRIAERFAKEGIEIPFPQMDVHMKK